MNITSFIIEYANRRNYRHDSKAIKNLLIDSTNALIKQDGFNGTNAPLAGIVSEDVKPRTFFSLTEDDVWNGNNSSGYVVMKVKIPAEYIRQANVKERPTEVYVENNPKDNGSGVYIPNAPATSTYFDRMIKKRYLNNINK